MGDTRGAAYLTSFVAKPEVVITARYECSTSSGFAHGEDRVAVRVERARRADVDPRRRRDLVVMVVTIRSRCSVTEAFRWFASKFAVHAALVPELATESARPGAR